MIGRKIVEVETGKVWKVVSLDIALGRMLIEPPDCKIPKEYGDWEWVKWVKREYWVRVRLSKSTSRFILEELEGNSG